MHLANMQAAELTRPYLKEGLTHETIAGRLNAMGFYTRRRKTFLATSNG